MEDDRSVVSEEPLGGVVVGGACVDDDRLADVERERELALEQRALRVVRGVVAEVVEARLADGDGSRMLEQRPELVEVDGLDAPASCGWMPRHA